MSVSQRPRVRPSEAAENAKPVVINPLQHVKASRSDDAPANSRFRQEADLNKSPTILGQMEKGNGFTAGFDYLRIGLAIAVLVWHSYILSAGSAALYRAAWGGPFRFLLAIILPMFFALSGFLVAGSLERTRAHQFVVLRALRLVPALAVEVTLSALLLGAFFTTLPLRRYLTSPELISYFGNIVGFVHFTLPGVFERNPAPGVVNSQLWTIPFELECYIVLLAISAVLRDRRGFVALVVLLSLVATALSFFLDPVSPVRAHSGAGACRLVPCWSLPPSLSRQNSVLANFRPARGPCRRRAAAGPQHLLSRGFPSRLSDCLARAHASAKNSFRRPLLRRLSVPLSDRAIAHADLSWRRILVAARFAGIALDCAVRLAVMEPGRASRS